MRVIDFTDGFESTSAPSGGSLIPLDYLDLNESTIPAAPAALDRRIWVNSSGILQVEDSLAANLVQVNTTSSQTLTNKTLTGNIALNLIGGSSAVITLPSATGTLATLNGTETFTNKTFVDVNFVIGDDIDATKKLKWELSSITTATTRTWTIPDVSDTLVGLVSTQTITGKTLTGNIALNLVGGSSSVITLPSVTGTLATLANAETLTNKTLTGNIAVNLMSGAATITLPVVTGTLATLAGTEVLTNKTLTGNTAVNLVSGAATITLPVVTGTLATLAGTEILTNKDIDGGTASNSLRITLPKDTLANLNALNRKEGTLVYASDTNALYADNGATLDLISSSTSSFNGFKNRIINGGMDIDQRNEGVLLNNPVSRLFSVDRFSISGSIASKFKATRTPSTIETGYAVRVAAGFPNYLELESLSAYPLGANEFYMLQQVITSNNFSDMAFGTASAQTVTLSFLVNSSLTGNFGGALVNEGGNRSYPFSYTVNSADTWETKTIIIPGDTSGTWNMTGGTGIGACVRFSMGASGTYTGTVNTWGTANAMGPSAGITQHINNVTSNNKLRLTGIQLEKGSSATSFDFRPHQTEFDLCLYYYNKSYQLGTVIGTSTETSANVSVSINSADFYDYGNVKFLTPMRDVPTINIYSSLGTSGVLRNLSSGSDQGNSGSRYHSTNGYAAFCANSAMTSNNTFAWHHTADAEH